MRLKDDQERTRREGQGGVCRGARAYAQEGARPEGPRLERAGQGRAPPARSVSSADPSKGSEIRGAQTERGLEMYPRSDGKKQDAMNKRTSQPSRGLSAGQTGTPPWPPGEEAVWKRQGDSINVTHPLPPRTRPKKCCFTKVDWNTFQ